MDAVFVSAEKKAWFHRPYRLDEPKTGTKMISFKRRDVV